jgi:hypothetical protein
MDGRQGTAGREGAGKGVSSFAENRLRRFLSTLVFSFLGTGFFFVALTISNQSNFTNALIDLRFLVWRSIGDGGLFYIFPIFLINILSGYILVDIDLITKGIFYKTILIYVFLYFVFLSPLIYFSYDVYAELLLISLICIFLCCSINLLTNRVIQFFKPAQIK